MSHLSRWGPLVVWSAVIFAFSHVPDLKSGLEYDYPLRKVAHAVEYAVLWLAARRALRSTAGAAAYAVAFAVLDEWHQTFVPGRAGQAADVLIDALGVLVCVTVFRRRYCKKPVGRAY